jgi:gliding motility-associated protein GldM
MAGGKETPRQKMIGMMYLVLTALLALNVSKEIIKAFVKLNDKIEDSNKIVEANIDGIFTKMESLMATKETKESTAPWYDKASKIKKICDNAYDFFIKEAAEMLKEADKKDMLVEYDDGGVKRYKLRSLDTIDAKDNYDVATHLFIGENPKQPNERGQNIRKRLFGVRDSIIMILADYKNGNKQFSFDPSKITENVNPKDPSTWTQLKEALKTANPEDTNKLLKIYLTLSYPEKAYEHGEETTWIGSLFDHSPVVGAAAMFTALRADIRTAQNQAFNLIDSKLESPIIKINKIEPMVFAPTGYLNVGDSMKVTVMIAAYDSTDMPQITYSLNGGESKNAVRSIPIRADSPGEKELKGTLGVKVKGEIRQIPWEYKYEVGQPMGVISPVEMNVLYAGYDNKIQATAAGFPPDKVSLQGPGVGGQTQFEGMKVYLVKPPMSSVGQKVTLSVNAEGKQVGKMEFRVRPMPNPNLFLGATSNLESSISKSALLGAPSLTAGYDASVPIKADFTINSWTFVATVNGNQVKKPVQGSAIPSDVKAIMRQLTPGSVITITQVNCRNNKTATQVKAPSMSFVIN